MAYPSVYPGSLDSYSVRTDNVDNVMAVDVNELQDAIKNIETKLGITSGDSILGTRAGIGVSSIFDISYVLEIRHSRAAGTTSFYHANTGAYAATNKVALNHAAMTDAQLRTMFTITSNFDVTADATRNSNIVISTAAAGTFGTTITINGRKVTFAGKVNVTLTAYANNTAAVAGGLVAGDFYRTNADPDTVCVVH